VHSVATLITAKTSPQAVWPQRCRDFGVRWATQLSKGAHGFGGIPVAPTESLVCSKHESFSWRERIRGAGGAAGRL
jgi:hypothetical protein